MLTDTIAKLIEQMLEESGGSLELQRNEMATRLGCVPSQIS
ncbi:MAG: CtsR family transcriptional regulator, partial [Clostridia bacterium]|nr:CtsR family transcriptional regulator [Clostridia bacterium]